ncbi:hypothetical protein H4582DRAFT_2058741 [Lactarius indigo]|nr:hypothetical protein H4582DRAFT_2058741 [Lactarius indigo]
METTRAMDDTSNDDWGDTGTRWAVQQIIDISLYFGQHPHHRLFLRPSDHSETLSFPSRITSGGALETGVICVFAPQSVEEPLQIIVRPVDEEVQAIPEPVKEPASPLVEGVHQFCSTVLTRSHWAPETDGTQLAEYHRRKPVGRVTTNYLFVTILAFSHAYRIDIGLCAGKTITITYRDSATPSLSPSAPPTVPSPSLRAPSCTTDTTFGLDGVFYLFGVGYLRQLVSFWGAHLGGCFNRTVPLVDAQDNRLDTNLTGGNPSSEDTFIVVDANCYRKCQRE